MLPESRAEGELPAQCEIRDYSDKGKGEWKIRKASAAQGKVFLNRFGQLGKGWGSGGEGVGLVMETIKKYLWAVSWLLFTELPENLRIS